MLWFDGPIENAVDRVKSSGIILVVFVQGNDELSKEYEVLLSQETKLRSNDYIAIKISDSSVAFQQFKQIYVNVPIPSLFLIDNNGTPINVVSSKNTSNILVAVNEALEKQKDSIKEIKKSDKKESDKNDGFLKSDKPIEKGTSKSSYAQNIGYKLFDVTEDEIKKRLNEIRAFPRFLLIDNTSPDPSSYSHPLSKIQSARIQFRLPNNDVPSWEFPDLSTLGDVRAYLMEKMNLSSNFKLLRVYPRTTFTPQDEQKTLEDLSLTPNATLIVIPVQDKTVQAKVKHIIVQQNFASLVIQTLLQPFLILINYFKKHVLKMEEESNNFRPPRLPSDTAIGKILNKRTSTSNVRDFNFDEDTENESEHPESGQSIHQRKKK